RRNRRRRRQSGSEHGQPPLRASALVAHGRCRRLPVRAGRPLGPGPPRTDTMPRVASDRIDDLLAPAYLEGLTSIPIDELRSRRSECQSVEGSLSYLRRLVQGRLDIVLSELHRRQEGEEPSDVSSIVEHLPEILSEKVRAS